MSLTIALKGTDGLVLASDSRITKGYTPEGAKTRDNSIKFIQLNDDWGTLTYGLSDIGNTGIASLKEEILKDLNRYKTIEDILEKGIQIFNSVNSDWSKNNSEIKRRDKDVGFILAGYERGERDFRIYNLQSPEFSPKLFAKGSLLAGQWHIAKFLINKLYTENQNISILKDLAVLILNETMTAEQTVGGAINLATITKSKGFQWMTEEEVKSIIKKNESFCNFFKEQFYLLLSSIADNGQKERNNRDVKQCQQG